MADASPVFYVAGIVLSLLGVWAIWVAVRPGPRWAEPAKTNPEPPKP